MMDSFTLMHLARFANEVCFDDEREAFIDWILQIDIEDFDYYCVAGWPAALDAFRRSNEVA